MWSKKCYIFLTVSAVLSTPIFAIDNSTPVLDSLRASAGSTAIASPEPSAQKLTDVATSTDPFSTDQAHTYWMQANSLYDDSVYTPPPQHRIDSPNGTDAVMLQGFDWYEDSYWNHPPNGWWGVLAQDAPQIGAAGFNIIWFPPTSVGSYYPTEWYNFDSQWGTGDVLKQAVKAMHSAGVKVLADIILGHRSGSTNWVDFRNPDWPTTVIVNNDCVWSQPAYQNLPRSPNPSEGELDSGSRNLDNRNTTVQHDAVVFMRWLRNTTGFDGWRYDEVKSYSGTHTEYYNNETSPEFSIGEYYDGDRQLVTNWIDSTDSSSGKANASSAFDFPTKFNLISAVESDNYSGMMSNGAPSGLIGWWPAKSVTFVENHDTSPRDPTFIANATAEYKAERLLGYVYILTHPGVPCVFWPHFFQWGTDYQNTIINLIKIRKTAGITSTSAIHVDTATNNLYAAYITGTHQTLAVKLGTSWSWTPNGTGWTMVTSGDRYAIWAK